ncbi:uncharacterized protein L201_003666 [Kwoniella dendrophila CBS 6074]|uniref:Transmembrane protein n=1 Tax=Kwoniella dendrophila CBS 6074 TaxID=1295534 RepID=A0AAX4JW51_9TREE
MSLSSSSSSSSSSLKSTANHFFLPFDPNSPLLVAKGVLATGTLGAITGASIGVVQSKNPFALSINMTINLSIAGLTFFSIREYLVSPLLLSIELTPSHTRRLNQLRNQSELSENQKGKLPISDDHTPSLSEVRWDRLSDSAISGGLTGGVLSAAFRGRATFVKAGITSSLIASILQLSVNQARVIRLKTLAKQTLSLDSQSQLEDVSTQPMQSTQTSSSNSSPLDDPIEPKSDMQSQITQSFESPIKSSNYDQNILQNTLNEKPSFPEKMMNSLTKILPVRKLSNDEYIQTLEKKKQDIEKRLKEIDDEEERMYNWSQSQLQK